ncbi:hypothetical protein [Duffyella gerundensis]|uniref:RipA family octameric membrane protein n=1 Tax=Duffyella gerundensis TaxID=1619313 RepID=UPI0012FECDCE|nr:hypothetical protein [Duffyella gerundensis]
MNDNLTDQNIPIHLHEHMTSQKKYFLILLKKDFTDINTIFTVEDKEKIKEAYNKAHHIREYEISLFWSRLNYLWAINAVLFAAWGIVINGMLAQPNFDAIQPKQYVILFIISIFGLALSYISHLITQAGKHWQEVWEYHVYLLEPFVSGCLYQMPFYKSIKKPSISRSISIFYYIIIFTWIFSAVLSAIVPFYNNSLILLVESFAGIILLLTVFFIDRYVRKASIKDISIHDTSD